jgi:endo-1,4-beta-xylanase
MKTAPMIARAVCLGVALSRLASACVAQTLREQAELTARFVSSAARSSQLTEPLYAATLAREFDTLEPEDEMKWEAIHPAPAVFDFLPADRLVAFAHLHGMQIRGHTLVWHHQLPAWLTSGNFSPAQLHHLLEEHIRTVMQHYRGQVMAWDVVNEAFDENGRLRSTIWYDTPGIGVGPATAFIETALRWARAADPGALLFLNEAECEAINKKSDAIFQVAQDFKRRGLPLDGIGLQMHVFDLNPDFEGIAANVHRFASLGLQIHITEMDVAIPVDADGHARSVDDLVRQAEIYRRVASICWAAPQCRLFQTWGFTDKYSWIRSSTHGAKGAALLWDTSYGAKATYFALRNGMQKAPAPPVSAPHDPR